MRHDLTDADVLRFVLAGCNAAEIAAYAGTPEDVAAMRMAHVKREYDKRLRPHVLHLPQAA